MNGINEMKTEIETRDPLRVTGSPPVVCLCGSTRFMDAFCAAGWELTLAGQIVLSVGVCKHGGEAIGPEGAERLDELHRRKIDLADWVLILNCCGYIGESTDAEEKYAEYCGKHVRRLFPTEFCTTPPDAGQYPSWESIAEATRETMSIAGYELTV